MVQFYRRLGSDVVVVEGTGQIAGHEDADVALALQRLLEAEGIEFRLNAQISRIEQAGGRIAVQLESDAAALQATDLFVATGRRPNTDDLGLETVGLKTTQHGFIEVNERLATNVRHPNSALNLPPDERLLVNGLIRFRAGKHTDDVGVAIGSPYHMPCVWNEFAVI